MSEKNNKLSEAEEIQNQNKVTQTRIHTHDEILGKKELSKVSRRSFLGSAAAAGALGAGALAFPGLLGKKGIGLAQTADIFECFGCEFAPTRGAKRAETANKIRVAAANYEFNMPIPAHPCNGDEKEYSDRNYLASFTKGIKRANGTDGSFFGEVDPNEYCKLLKALDAGSPALFEAILLGFSSTALSDAESKLGGDAFEPNRQRRLENPQAGLNYDLEGKDYYQLINRPDQRIPPGGQFVAFPPAPNFSSDQEGNEIIEVYWQALTRDVPFIQYNQSTRVQQAVTDLNNFLPSYKGPLGSNGTITPQVYSRGILKGDTTGPFLSQFFLRDIPYGAQSISAKINSPEQSTIFNRFINDFLRTREEWLMIQTGQTPDKEIKIETKRFIRSGRDLAQFVRNDAIYQTYLNAALLLMTPAKSGGFGVPVNPNNPYRADTGGYRKQNNFVEFGPSQLLSLLGEVSVRAHKAVWYQKWNVHRRLRPEEYGGRIFFTLNGQKNYPISQLIYRSSVFQTMLNLGYGTVLLPQAFPEGSPMHPSYGAGHATLAGAAVTILKAWFDSEEPFLKYGDVLEPNADGSAVQPFNPASDKIDPTVADELNKLASNVSLARDIAGVHWRSDYTESVFLGEKVAIQLLEDYGYTYNESFPGFQFRNFDGNMITVGGRRTI